MVSPFILHRHEAFWPNPESFDPERFAAVATVLIKLLTSDFGQELLKKLESKYLERESADIQKAIDQTGEASPNGLNELMRRKSEVMRRKAELDRRSRRKGNELGD